MKRNIKMAIRKVTALVSAAVIAVCSTCFSGFGNTGTVNAVEVDLKNSLIVKLNFDGDVNDGSGKGNNGKLSKEGVYEAGISGKALNLGGNTYVDLGTSALLQPEDLTVSMWIKANAALSGEHMLAWFKPDKNYQGNGWYLSCLDNGTPLKISIGESSGQPYEAYVSGSRNNFFPAGEWVHIAATFNSKTREVSIYRNGIAQEVLYLNAPAGITGDSNSHKYIGFNSPGYGGGYANITIDEFALYGTCASAGEVADMYTEFGAVFDAKRVADADFDALNFITKEIKEDIELPAKGKHGSVITWETSDAGIISADGKVTRPQTGSGDAKVTLTAVITCRDVTRSKKFDFTVPEYYVFNALEDFGLSDVEVTDSYEMNALKLEIVYLKSLDSDRLLKGFRNIAGIPSDAKLYDGWENSEIKGHTMGHYLTALAQTYGTTGDAEILDKIVYITDSLAESQSASGYLAAIPESKYVQIESGNTSGTWVPWYTMHKILAGLVNVYAYTGNAKALDTASKLGDWVYSRTSKWSAQVREKVLAVEYGGMNDCLYELYKYTKKKEHLEAAHAFDEMSLFESLYNGKDVLNGRHANTTIPKIIGALNRYITLGEGEEYYLKVAQNFFNIVAEHHTYVTGGNSENEHFGQANILDAERTDKNCETCNTYNMLKLAKELFKLTGDVMYADYYENTFINAILSSQNPETGMTTYFQPMATGYFKVYGSQFSHFWCCTGTGMENFTKMGTGIYYKAKNGIYVTQYTDSTLTWKDGNLKLIQDSTIPDSNVTKFTINAIDGKTVNTDLYIRMPDWCEEDITITVNKTAVKTVVSRGFITLGGPWNDGDVIEITIPMKTFAYTLPDNESAVAFKYGPIVLSAALGTKNMATGTTGVNVTVPLLGSVKINDNINIKSKTVKEWLREVSDNVVKTEGKLEFTLKDTDSELIFTPHYMQHKERYGIYFKLTDNKSEDSEDATKKILENKEKGRFENAVIDSIPISNDQYELQHNMAAVSSSVGSFKGYMYRDASGGGSFSYDMKVDNGLKNYLQVKYYSGDAGRTFKVYADNALIADVMLKNENPDNFYDVRYEIPAEVIKDKEKVTIKFAAESSGIAGGIFDMIYMVRDYSSKAVLKELAVDGKSYSGSIKDDMTVYVAEEISEIKLELKPEDVYGLIYTDGILMDDAVAKTVKLTGKTTGMEIVVKAEDHKTSKTYKLNIVKDNSKLGKNEYANMKMIIIAICVTIALIVIIVPTAAILIIKREIKNRKKGESIE